VRILPLAGILLLALIAGVWRPWLQYRRHGTTGIVLFRSGSWRQHIRDAMLIGLFVVLLAQAWAAANVRADAGADALQWCGAALLFGGIGLLVASQLDLGASWRIGIDAKATPGLVTDGLYRYSRNPIYVGLAFALAGYTLMLPTALSIVALLAALVGIRMQVLAEEAYLVSTYGEAFREYARRVGRFVPGLGRLK
jgi:protein-S-isoprenylcysteine O-methyltransferase Ste14